MPMYEYRCKSCHKRFSRLLLSFSAAASYNPQCPYCESRDVQRLVSRVYNLKSASPESSEGTSEDTLPDFDENDPRSMGRLMRQMSEETGEDMGPEFNEVVQRLEKGEDPEQIEHDMPELGNEMSDGIDETDI